MKKKNDVDGKIWNQEVPVHKSCSGLVRNRRKSLLILGLLWLIMASLMGCQPKQNTMEQNSATFLANVQKTIDKKEKSFALGSVATFDWDEGWIFTPYATKKSMELQTGIQSSLFQDSPGYCQLIFAKDKKVVAYVGSLKENFSFSYPLAMSVDCQPLSKDTGMEMGETPQGTVIYLEKFKPKVDANQPFKSGKVGGDLGKIKLQLKPEDYPKVDGSTATIPLSEAFGAAVMNLPLEEARQHILHNTTHSAYVNLIDGKADIIFVTHPSKEELALAKENGVQLEVVPVVSEGFVFLVNKNNPVKSLKFDEIKKIYMGKITNWKEVGGKDEAILPFQRPVNSGSQSGMLELVVPEDQIMEAPKEWVQAGMGDLIEAVSSYDNSDAAIGYSYYYYATDMWKNSEVRLLAVDDVEPNAETIENGSYPVQTAYYAVLNKNTPKDSNTRKLLKWILSEQGQAIAKEAGYVPLGK